MILAGMIDNMAILYIIGNGFDLHFNLKTSPENFENILKKKCIYNETDNAYDILSTYGINWSEYEQSLAELDLDEIENRNIDIPDYLSDHEYDRDGGIVNMQMYIDSINEAISSALIDMVKVANGEVERRNLVGENYKLFNSGDAILSFNYTSTIEQLFDLPENIPILHIHGFYEKQQPLIFGYKLEKECYERKWKSYTEDGDYYIDQQRQIIYEFYKSQKKVIQMNILNDFLNNCRGINKIVVLGHSMGPVDSDYMEQIERVLQPLEWEIYFHDSNDVKVNSQMYSFFSKIRFIKW